jgi:hypothetical protein
MNNALTLSTSKHGIAPPILPAFEVRKEDAVTVWKCRAPHDEAQADAAIQE